MMLHPTHRQLLLGLFLIGALACGPVAAFTLEEFAFEDPAQTDSFRDLIGKLRCLVCQNESLAGSQAGVAQDLREEVYRMMQEGKTEDDIIAFLVARYGDFVLYEPPLKPSTYLLWLGPFLFIALGGYLLVRAIRRKQAEPEQELSADERARLKQLLAETDDRQD